MDNNINIVISAKNMAQKAFNDASKSLKTFSASAVQSSQDFAKAFALGGVVTGGLTTIIGKYGSEIQNMNNRLLAVSGSQEKANEQFERNIEIAKRARTDIETVNSVFARFELVQKRIGGTTEETEQMVENLSKGLQVFGASTSEVNSVMLQFSQAMGSGRLQGDEFRSISENFPPLLDELAKVTGKATSELKDFASQGGITSEVMKKALLGMTEKLNDQFSKMPVTIGQAMTNLKNIFLDSLKKIDEGTGIFTKISLAIASFGLWIEKITPSVINFLNSLDANQLQIIAGAIIGALVPAFVALTGSIVAAMAPLIPFMALGALVAANFDKIRVVVLSLIPAMTALAATFIYFKAQAMITATIASLTGGMVGLTGALAALKAGLILTRAAVTGFFISLGPIGIAIAGITAAVTALTYVFVKYKDEAKKSTEEAMKAFEENASSAEKNLDRLVVAYKGNYEKALQHVKDFGNYSDQEFQGIVLKMMENAAIGGDVGRVFAIAIANGFSSEQAREYLENQGIIVTSSMLEGIKGAEGQKAYLLGQELAASIADGLKTGISFIDNITGSVSEKISPIAAKAVTLFDKLKSSVKIAADESVKKIDEMSKGIGGMTKKTDEAISKMEALAEATKGSVQKLQTGYEKWKENLENLSESHKKIISDLRADLTDYQEKLAQLGTRNEDRTVDFQNEAAKKIVDIQKEISDTKEQIKNEEDANERRNLQVKLSELETALRKNASFISSIDAQVQEQKKISEMDELSRMIYLYNQETEALRAKYTADIAALNSKIATENSSYASQAEYYANVMQKMAKAALERMAKTELWSKDHLAEEIKKSENFFADFNNILKENSESAEVKGLISVLDEIFAKAQAAIEATQKAMSAGGIGSSGGNYISGKREKGGSVSSGSSYLVGEAGPEIFSPSSSGYITPNNKIGGGSNITINITGGVFSNASDFADFVSRKIAKNLSSSYA